MEFPPPSAPTKPPHPARTATFRALRHRNYRLYFYGQLISLTGSWIQTTALMWLAFDLTRVNTWPALILTAQLLPTFLFGAWGGMLADHWPKRRLILLTQTGFMVLAFALAALVWSGTATPWQLLLITAGSGLVQAVDLPARLAFVVDMVGRDDLINAVALNALQFNAARLVGPAMGGWLLIGLGAGPCFLVNGLSYLAVLAAVFWIDVPGAAHPSSSSDRRSLLDGFRHLIHEPTLFALILVAGTTAFCGWPFLSLLPALAEHRLASAAQGYSLMLSGTGLGALAAALTVATFGSESRRRSFIGAGVGIISMALVALALVHSLSLAIGCCALIGFGLILFLSTSQAVVQLSAGDHNRGRVMGIWAMILSGAVPLGNVIAGPAADRWGEGWVLAVQGIGCGLMAVGLFGLLRRWRR